MTMCVVSAAIAAAATELFTRILFHQVRLLQPTHADIVIEGSRGLDQLAVYRVAMGVSSFARKGHSR
jgi:hypothetical protein